ncbi:MAG TPA: tRNA (adenosine(37)-N6)-threonylcarbamoyltransferase complex dimerization subunit type 1 TsaB [Burkholderiales bacterium]|nr:tRNA (adenosine(37)-N6)-threonylcarbamoyltransferase complex dimerization subunit type 1 TsaB [Burkholderiales bacterium]
MNILVLESSTDRLSLALGVGERVYECDFHAGQTHAESILDEIGRLLETAQLSLADLQAIVYGEGPGAFTGLRIACGNAQGLALARGLPVLGIGNLLAVAEESGAVQALVCLDARMGEVYHAAYRKDAGDWHTVSAPGLYKPAEVPVPSDGGWIGCGSGFAAYGEMLENRLKGRLTCTLPDIYPTARAMLKLAKPRLEAGAGQDAATAAPIYIRDKVAFKTHER